MKSGRATKQIKGGGRFSSILLGSGRSSDECSLVDSAVFPGDFGDKVLKFTSQSCKPGRKLRAGFGPRLRKNSDRIWAKTDDFALLRVNNFILLYFYLQYCFICFGYPQVLFISFQKCNLNFGAFSNMFERSHIKLGFGRVRAWIFGFGPCLNLKSPPNCNSVPLSGL